MIRMPRRLHPHYSALACAIGVAACGPSFDDSKSLVALKSANEGVIFINVTYAGMPCDVGHIALATEPLPGHFVLHSAPMIGGAAMNSRQILVPAGEYHIGYIQCGMGGKFAAVGDTDGTIFVGNPRQSLAHITVSAGEVVNVGQINIVPTDYQANFATLAITDISAPAMERLRSGVPKLSSTLVTRLVAETLPGQSHKISWVQMGNG